jgi:hypothetical protein
MNPLVSGLLSKVSSVGSRLVGGPTLALDPLLEGSRRLSRFLADRGLAYDPRKDPRLQNRTAPYYGPAYGSAEALGLGTPGPSLRNYGPRYKERELAAGAAAERFRPGAGFPGQQGAADRAYQAELSRTSQLTAQDPELQRYEKARVSAKTQEEMDAVRDMGLQMWQQKYGATPMEQPGGAIGSFNPLMQQTFGYQTGMAPSQLGQASAATPASPVGIGENQYQSGDLGTRAMLETGYDPAAYGISPEMIEEMQKRLLNQSAK